MLNSNQWLPRIDQSKCTGCRECVDACPVDALVQIDSKATWRNPELCTYCIVCEDLCPTNAIELPFLILYAFEEDIDEEH